MFSFLTIFRREMSAYFNSAIAYIFIIVFVLLNNGLYMTEFFLVGRADMRPFFGILPFVLSVFIPAMTMRSWAEERKGNTLELLLTFPMSPLQLVAGKFLAAMCFYAIALAATLPVPVMLHVLGQPDSGMILGGYIGALFLGAFYTAVGLFVSGLVRDQIVAFILAMIACFSLQLAGMDFIAVSLDGWISGAGLAVKNVVASSAHFESFSKGIIDTRSVLYFVTGTLLFLLLNSFWLEGRMRAGAKSFFLTAFTFCVGIFLAVNILMADVSQARFDLTEGKLYTISPATRDILHNLDAPVTLTYYVSPGDKMPSGLNSLEQDVSGKLEELRIASGGTFKYKVVPLDPLNLKEEGSLEIRLAEKGIQPFQVQSVEADEVGVRLVYSAMSIAYKDKAEEVIPGVTPQNLPNLEYLLASKIFRMTRDFKTTVTLVAPYEESQIDPTMAALLTQMGGGKLPERYRNDQYELVSLMLQAEGYDVHRSELTEEDGIAEGSAALVILEPQHLNERQRYEIDRYLAGGGSVFMAVQNYVFQYQPLATGLNMMPEPRDPGVNELISGWGLSVRPEFLSDEQSEIIQLGGGIFGAAIPIKAPLHIMIPAEQMNQSVSITSRIDSLFYLWGSALGIDEKAVSKQGLEVTPLFESSKDSWLTPFQPKVMSLTELNRADAVEEGPFVLGALVTGTFPDLYAGRAIPAWPEAPAPENPETEQAAAAKQPEISEIEPAPGKLILMGAATLFQKQILQHGGHAYLFMNAMDILTMGDELIGIRSKQTVNREIARVDSKQKVFWKTVVTLLTPLLIALAGALRVMWRKNSKKRYMRQRAAAASAL